MANDVIYRLIELINYRISELRAEIAKKEKKNHPTKQCEAMLDQNLRIKKKLSRSA